MEEEWNNLVVLATRYCALANRLAMSAFRGIEASVNDEIQSRDKALQAFQEHFLELQDQIRSRKGVTLPSLTASELGAALH